MKLHQINYNALRVFLSVYKTGSMTLAASQLYLTQSGVSQYIHTLEEEFNRKLFTRLPRKIVPTPFANDLYEIVNRSFLSLELGLSQLLDIKSEISGKVRIGMPIEFGTNRIVPLLSELGNKFKEISFEITLDYTSVLQEKILNDDLDFAFIDQAPKDRRISYQAVASEKILLCTTAKYIAQYPKLTYSSVYFEQLEYIEYKGEEPILRRWMLHHLKRKNLKLKVRAHIMDVQGVAKFVTSGLGVGALPDHVVEKLKESGYELKVFEGKMKPLVNEISLAKLKNHPLSRASQLTLDELMKSL